MSAQAPTVCILYGFCEGPLEAIRFRRLLRAAGYQITTSSATADIIIGHSGGCFLVPEHPAAKLIIQIGIPYWPGRSILKSLCLKIIADWRDHHKGGSIRFWLRKTGWNGLYFWNMVNNVRMLRGRHAGTLWRFGSVTTVVRPEKDPVCTPDASALPFTTPPRFITIPGQHDDCWRYPQDYIALIQAEYAKRA